MLQLVSLCGIAVMLAICFVFSRDRSAIKWRLVRRGLGIQWVLGLVFIYWET
ncbi:MAG TPA: NupC/NupG family nucleoside CNT transporter, partial [Planctomycetes bacterium]|nr:NupC/NupG family nucleoside CNT transporter [Planctomycetota bacterium]